MNEWIAVVDQLRKLKPNPRITHIDYFADKVDSHIEHVRKGLSVSDARAVRALNRLKKHAGACGSKAGGYLQLVVKV